MKRLLPFAIAGLQCASWFTRSSNSSPLTLAGLRHVPAVGQRSPSLPLRTSSGPEPAAHPPRPTIDSLASALAPPLREWDPRGFRISAPHFADPAERATFKHWWTDELLRRLTAWEHAHPRDGGYPSPAWTRGQLARLYDAAEEGSPDEPESSVRARVAAGLALTDELTRAYGDSPSGIASQLPPPDDQLVPPPSLPAGWAMTVPADDPAPLLAGPPAPALPYAAARPRPGPVDPSRL